MSKVLQDFYKAMESKGFKEKVQQLKEINIDLEEDDAIESKKKTLMKRSKKKISTHLKIE